MKEAPDVNIHFFFLRYFTNRHTVGGNSRVQPSPRESAGRGSGCGRMFAPYLAETELEARGGGGASASWQEKSGERWRRKRRKKKKNKNYEL